MIKGNGFLDTENLNSELRNRFGTDVELIETSSGWFYKSSKGYNILKDGKIEEGKLLPEKFQQVEYIQSNGRQNIDTGVKLNINSKIEFYAKCDDGSQGYFLSAGEYYKENVMFIKLELNGDKLGWYYGVKAGAWLFSKIITNPSEFKVSVLNRKCIINDYIEYENEILSSGECNYSCSIMNCNGQYYYFKIYQGDKLIRSFIPCYCLESVLDNKENNCPIGTVGMYDIVEGKFYKNQTGAGNFQKGNDI